jgi:hypothetical protein
MAEAVLAVLRGWTNAGRDLGARSRGPPSLHHASGAQGGGPSQVHMHADIQSPAGGARPQLNHSGGQASGMHTYVRLACCVPEMVKDHGPCCGCVTWRHGRRVAAPMHDGQWCYRRAVHGLDRWGAARLGLDASEKHSRGLYREPWRRTRSRGGVLLLA